MPTPQRQPIRPPHGGHAVVDARTNFKPATLGQGRTYRVTRGHNQDTWSFTSTGTHGSKRNLSLPRQREYYEQTVAYIMPLTESRDWWAAWYASWQQEHRDLA